MLNFKTQQFIMTTSIRVIVKNSFCILSVFTSTKIVMIANSTEINIIEPTIRKLIEILCPMNAFNIKNTVFGNADAKLRSEVNVVCIGVRGMSVALVVVFRNLNIQY